MIYIGQACSGVCKGCGRLVEGCCSCLGSGCSGLGQCLSNICLPCEVVLNRPLGGYVIFTMFICIPAAVFAGFAFTNQDLENCKDGTTVTGVNLGLSIAHVFMALYLQTRLHYGLQRRDLPLSAEQSGDSQAPSEAKVLMQSAGKIVLYDVLFCLYVLVFAGSFVYQFYVLSWFFGSCHEGGLVLGSAICLLIFSCMASSFTCCWWTAMMCGDFLSKGPLAGFMKFLVGSRGDHPSAQQPSAPPRQVVEGAPVYPQPGYGAGSAA